MIRVKKKNVLIAAIIGVMIFLCIYGVTPLDVTNDYWIFTYYDEHDIVQHYVGWLAFRNSDWEFPLGLANNIAYGDGTIISFLDSIPIVAIFFKLFRNFLPSTFQYFGLYTLLCYILQCIAAYKLLYYKTKNSLYSLLGCTLFGFAPVLMERAFRHTALGSQWIILFALYLYLKNRDKPNMHTYIGYCALE